jgi:hypothetical protein
MSDCKGAGGFKVEAFDAAEVPGLKVIIRTFFRPTLVGAGDPVMCEIPDPSTGLVRSPAERSSRGSAM